MDKISKIYHVLYFPWSIFHRRLLSPNSIPTSLLMSRNANSRFTSVGLPSFAITRNTQTLSFGHMIVPGNQSKQNIVHMYCSGHDDQKTTRVSLVVFVGSVIKVLKHKMYTEIHVQ